MSKYKTSKCPNCDSYFEYINIETTKSTSIYGVLGPPVVKCHNCNSLLKTKSLLWSQMSKNQKFSYKFSLYLKDIFFTFAEAIFVIMLSLNIFFPDTTWNLIENPWTIGVLFLIYYIIRIWFRVRKSNRWLDIVIKEIQDDYDLGIHTHR
tara:strand:+ start:247 stop:696 length:450 start_codon:yes stop_codon:yes gene_type:complete